MTLRGKKKVNERRSGKRKEKKKEYLWFIFLCTKFPARFLHLFIPGVKGKGLEGKRGGIKCRGREKEKEGRKGEMGGEGRRKTRRVQRKDGRKRNL